MSKEIVVHVVTPNGRRAKDFLVDHVDSAIMGKELEHIREALIRSNIIVDPTATLIFKIKNSTEYDTPNLAGLEGNLKKMTWKRNIEN